MAGRKRSMVCLKMYTGTETIGIKCMDIDLNPCTTYAKRMLDIGREKLSEYMGKTVRAIKELILITHHFYIFPKMEFLNTKIDEYGCKSYDKQSPLLHHFATEVL